MTGNSTEATPPNRRGLSLLEILMVVGILAIVSSAAVPYAEITFIRAKEAELETNLKNLRLAVGAWRGQCYSQAINRLGRTASLNECYFFPTSLASLTREAKDTINFTYFDGTPGKFDFYHRPFLSEIPIDPFVGYATWTLHFSSGTIGIIDVSPVADPATRRGFVEAIDGTQYKDW